MAGDGLVTLTGIGWAPTNFFAVHLMHVNTAAKKGGMGDTLLREKGLSIWYLGTTLLFAESDKKGTKKA
jgi:hypothetical protein